MAKLTEEQLVTIVKTEFSQSTGADDKLDTARQLAWDRYLSLVLGNEVEGESQVRTSDVSDVVDGTMPPLLRMFTSADNLVSFDATDQDDVPQAEQETDYVSHVFFKENEAFLILFFWFFDALVAKNGYVAAWWDDSEKVTEETHKNRDIDEVTELLADPELEPLEREDNEDGTHNIRFRRVTKRGRCHVESVPPSEMRISGDANSVDPNSGRMVGRERLIARTDLIDMGFDPVQVGELQPTAPTSKTKAPSKPPTTPPIDKSQELIRINEGYLKVDFDGDGRAELRQVFLGDDKLLHWKDRDDGSLTPANIVVDRQPYHCISPTPLPHQHVGRSLADKVIENQDTTTTILRGALNNLFRVNNPGHAVWEQGMTEDTLDDLLTSRVGRVARFSRPVDQSYKEMTTTFTGAASLPVLEYFDRVKRERSGISSDGEGLKPEALKNIQTTLFDKAIDESMAKIETTARIFAETGLKSLFLHMREILMKHQDKAKVVRLRNTFVEVNPKKWRTREGTTIHIVLGIGTRQQNLINLEAISKRQAEQVQGGGMNLLVTPQNIWRTNQEFVKNANLMDPSLFFTDPGDQLAPPPQDAQQEFEQKEQALEERRQKLDNDRNQINVARVDLERQKLQLTHERETAKIEGENEERLDKFAIANEKLRNDIAELQMEASGQPLEDKKTEAEIEKLGEETDKIRAETEKTREETRAAELETDATESGILEVVEELGQEQT